ncbi:MAG: L-aspartate oxidase [Lachnospiraceae bacterium]|nr:L-aspartate oxidase [Lachnospiraceae bacterium]
MKTDVVIVGTGAAGLFAALHMPSHKKVLMITKKTAEESDSYLAQGGICMLRNEDDYDGYFNDTMKAGHYKNDKKSVDIMIRSSQEIISELIEYGVDFEHHHGHLAYTKEGAHGRPRILFHEDQTGKEITSKLLRRVKERDNIIILENTTMIDFIVNENKACEGIVVENSDGSIGIIQALYTVLACGGVGGIYRNSTNFRHICADAIAIAMNHGIELRDMGCVQIHPTTLYSEKPGRRFLISESVRGEGAILLNKEGKRFVNELLPRDVVANAIWAEMEKDKTPYEWLSFEKIPEKKIRTHFPNIYRKCLEEGYDCLKEPVPIVPAQHYFMGGIKVGYSSKTSMERLYAVGETSCNGVHGANRLASNSLLESMVFAQKAACEIAVNIDGMELSPDAGFLVDYSKYNDLTKLKKDNKEKVLKMIETLKAEMQSEFEKESNEMTSDEVEE